MSKTPLVMDSTVAVMKRNVTTDIDNLVNSPRTSEMPAMISNAANTPEGIGPDGPMADPFRSMHPEEMMTAAKRVRKIRLYRQNAAFPGAEQGNIASKSRMLPLQLGQNVLAAVSKAWFGADTGLPVS